LGGYGCSLGNLASKGSTTRGESDSIAQNEKGPK